MKRSMRALFILMSAAICWCGGDAGAQGLRFSNHREITKPDYATIMVGPFFSNIEFSQSAGFRYTRSSGAGTAFLYENDRGKIVEDGWECPLVSYLGARNYLIITKNMDLDISFSLSYEHYPMETQEDAFNADLAEESLSADLSQDLSTEILITDDLKATLSDAVVYKADYVNTRGLTDTEGGSRNVYFQNNATIVADWLVADDQNIGFNLGRIDYLPQLDEFKSQRYAAWSESIMYQRRLAHFLSVGVSVSGNQTDFADDERMDPSFVQESVFAHVTFTENTRGYLSVGYGQDLTDYGPTNDVNNEGMMTGSLSLETRLTMDMMQTIQYSRGQRAGFAADAEHYDQGSYALGWSVDQYSFNFSASYGTVTPVIENVPEYSNASYGFSASLPVTSFAALKVSSTYAMMMNGDSPDGVEEVEWLNDYDTWTSSIGTGFRLTENVNFELSASHVARLSDAEELEYTRDYVSGFFRYTHQF